MLNLIIGLLLIILFPALYIIVAYSIIPHKSLKEGLKDWIKESEDDI